MSLTRKVTLIVILVFMLSGLLRLGVQQLFIMPSFLALEQETARKNTERVLGAIRREIVQITPSIQDWAQWDDTYGFAKGEKPDFVEDNLYEATLTGLSVNFLAVYNASGKPLWSMAMDLETKQPIDLGALTGVGLPAGHPLLEHPNLTSKVSGLLVTDRAPLMIVAAPILTDVGEGPPAGTFMLGRFLDTAAVEQLAEQTRLTLSASPTDANVAADWIGDTRQGLARTPIALEEQPDVWQANTTLSDLFGQPLLALRVDTPRDISARGSAAVQASLWSLAATGLLTMFVMWLLLRYTLLRPVSQLTEHAVRVGADDNLRSRLNMNRQDEVGILARTFDEMVDRLAEARRRLVDQSYQSGIAEMASGVLHNIGNAVTPLNVRLSTLSRDLRAGPVAEMEQTTAELAEPATPPERRADLVQFVELAGVELTGLVKRSRDEVAAAAQQVVHVQEILADQERFSRSARVIEPRSGGWTCVRSVRY